MRVTDTKTISVKNSMKSVSVTVKQDKNQFNFEEGDTDNEKNNY